MSFHPRSEQDLQTLDEDALVAYGRDARAAGDRSAARTALALLVFGLRHDVRRRVSLRVPADVVDEVADEVLVRAIGSAFDGTSIGEFRSWLSTILRRTVADHFRRAARQPRETPLGGQAGDAEDAPPGPEPAVDAESGRVELSIVVDGVLDTLADTHRQVIELHVFGGLPASEVCERIDGMQPDNVAKIASRFRERLRAELGDGTEDA